MGVARIQATSRNLPGGTEENHENLSEVIGCSGIRTRHILGMILQILFTQRHWKFNVKTIGIYSYDCVCIRHEP
jgi:hypothetical protein